MDHFCFWIELRNRNIELVAGIRTSKGLMDADQLTYQCIDHIVKIRMLLRKTKLN